MNGGEASREEVREEIQIRGKEQERSHSGETKNPLLAIKEMNRIPDFPEEGMTDSVIIGEIQILVEKGIFPAAERETGQAEEMTGSVTIEEIQILLGKGIFPAAEKETNQTEEMTDHSVNVLHAVSMAGTKDPQITVTEEGLKTRMIGSQD